VALYGEAYAFIGFYIVRPDLRGHGIGSALFDRALKPADGRVVGLDGVLAQQGSYERRGFVLAHRNVRWHTIGGGGPPAGLAGAVGCAVRGGARHSTRRSSAPSGKASCAPGSTARPAMRLHS
jgi:hypothetical protein